MSGHNAQPFDEVHDVHRVHRNDRLKNGRGWPAAVDLPITADMQPDGRVGFPCHLRFHSRPCPGLFIACIVCSDDSGHITKLAYEKWREVGDRVVYL